MTPGARLQAAIEILDTIRGGKPAEQVLTNWGRGHRFAGSKDRAAIRDHVFDCLRCLRSFAHLGGRSDGRGLVLGLLRSSGTDPTGLFTGTGYSPAALGDADAPTPAIMPRGVALDCPDWVLPHFDRSLGTSTDLVLDALRQRAPVFLRVNLARTSVAQAADRLAREGIETRGVTLAPQTALQVTTHARRIRQSAAFTDGWVELQDAASQAVVAELGDLSGLRALDFCAGGGGKALALAAAGAHVTAHDVDFARMQDLPERAARAGARIAVQPHAEGRFDLVMTDVPCSGCGAWRRAPEGKWTLTDTRLAQLLELQGRILAEAWDHVLPGGKIVYATCSLLDEENIRQCEKFVAANGRARLLRHRRFTPLDGGDGFFVAIILKEK